MSHAWRGNGKHGARFEQRECTQCHLPAGTLLVEEFGWVCVHCIRELATTAEHRGIKKVPGL